MLKLTRQKTLDLRPLYRSTSVSWHLQLRTGGVSFLLFARPCNKALIPNIRNVNSREIAFPGQESQFPGIDRDSLFHPSTYLLVARSESDRRRGCEGGGERGDCRPVEDAGPHRRVRTTDQQRAVVHPKHHTSGERDQGSAMADRPPDDRPGNRLLRH